MNVTTKPIILFVSVDEKLLVSTAMKIAGNDSVIVYPEAGLHPSRHMRMVTEHINRALATNSRLVIATHSEGIVGGIGERIEAKRWPSSAFAIVIVGKDEQLRICGYDTVGDLTNWPIGFFSPCDADDDYDGIDRSGRTNQ